jgi:hypothetical protein
MDVMDGPVEFAVSTQGQLRGTQSRRLGHSRMPLVVSAFGLMVFFVLRLAISLIRAMASSQRPTEDE